MPNASEHVIKFMGAHKMPDRTKFSVLAGCTDCPEAYVSTSFSSIADARKAAYQRHRRNHKGAK